MLKRLGSMARIAAAALGLFASVHAGGALAQAAAEDALKQIIAEGSPALLAGSSTLIDRERIGKMYADLDYRLLWSEAGKPTPVAIGLIQELRRAADRGLDPGDYPGARLAALTTELTGAAQSDEGQWAQFDAGLSLAALRFLSDLHYGRIDPATVGHNLSVDRIKLDLPAELAQLATVADVAKAIDAFEPQFTHYALLKHHLARYRDLAAQAGINDLPPLAAKALKPGAVYAGAAQLQRLLLALEDFGPGATAAASPAAPAAPATAMSPATPAIAGSPSAPAAPAVHATAGLPATPATAKSPATPATPAAPAGPTAPAPASTPASAAPAAAAAVPALAPTTLTPSLVAALKSFQSRHGERVDGVLGAATFAELTKPLGVRVRQIELTMERWRWLPSELVSAPIIVNIPQFRLFAFESTTDVEARIRQMDVIVGKAFEATQTPVFSADMTYVIFRPYWDIPYSISVKEIVPAARRNPAYIDAHQMEIVRGGDTTAAVMPNTAENIELVAKGVLRVRQKPGPNNSLGLVKFMLPNPYNVYLHSTPAEGLFAESRRAFSHGCVRVSDPVGLAEYVLRDSPEWTREKILSAMNGAEPLTVTLKNRIRVFFVYGTALATEDGRVLFFDDIYGHDQRLEEALNSRRPRTAALDAPDAPDASLGAEP
jgi:murein L,D-transpeptidase YcbB/YkuD